MNKNGGRIRGKKLFYFLTRMQKAEKDAFGHWLESPIHENSPQLLDMLRILLDELELAEEPCLTPEMFSSVLSPDRALDAKKATYIWTRLAQLQKALFDFLAWQHSTLDAGFQGQFLLEAMCDRGWEKYTHSAYDSASKKLNSPGISRELRKRLDLETTLNGHLAALGRPEKDNHLDEVHLAIDAVFVHEKIKYACAGLIQGHPDSDPSQSPSLETALRIAGDSEGDLPIATATYWYAYRMIRAELRGEEESEELFKRFYSLFLNLNEFSSDETVDLFTYGQNFCILRFRKGATGFVDTLQKLYDLILENGAILQMGKMPLQFYKNAVELMCRFKRYEWSENFVESYGTQIAHDPDNTMYHYNLAVIRFYQGRFREVMELLYQRLGALDRLQSGWGARVYFCKSLWEGGERIWLLSVLSAFEQHLRRNKSINAVQKASYLGFVSYLRRASLAVTGDPDKQKLVLGKLIDEINQREPKDKHTWLRSRIEAALAASSQAPV
jgi:hypothetical protein